MRSEKISSIGKVIGLFILALTLHVDPSLAANYRVIAVNDLGMHCADTDYRMFSILPPYNVLNAQVLLKGAEPELLGPQDGITVTYRAVSSNIIDPNDPDFVPLIQNSITSTSQNNTSSGVYKGNFWEIGASGDPQGKTSYRSLYPTNVLDSFLLEPDLGLPAPNLVELYLGGGNLIAEQAEMPGKADPFYVNESKPFHGFVETLPFFVNFPFGYTAPNFKRFTAEGIPITPTDDQGNTNPYPLMRVEAKNAGGDVLASVDTVVPVASEADCQMCHASQDVCLFDTGKNLVCDNIANSKYIGKVTFIEDASLALGDTPKQKVINAAKLNILRLHDYKHDTTLAGDQPDGSFADGTTPNVVCTNCHYSPALDLAHLGPNDDNGKEQTKHASMSRVMHGYHGALASRFPEDYGDLFPNMLPPNMRTAQQKADVLDKTCYSCHPGKQTKCLRGAMAGGGRACQDCHGQMTQVGNDFSENFPNVAGDVDLSKRVPWASEPKCQSCHMGDVRQTQQLQLDGALRDTLINRTDKYGNPDGLRLQMAYKYSAHKINGGSDKLSFLDFSSSRFASNLPLYRLSGGGSGDKGHGGLSCEGCHGSTHAIWPNQNPWSNDNKTAMDIQGHAGPIIECGSCHEGDLGTTLDGPHGMHPVGDTSFARDHEHFAERQKDSCRSCHGMNGEGSVLSRTAAQRRLRTDDHGNITLEKGEIVTCSQCHSNKLRGGTVITPKEVVDDFNGDGKSDILIRNTGSGQLYLYAMDGNIITPSNIGGLSTSWVVRGIGDFGGDGKSDILLRNSSSGQLYLYEMDGNRVTPSNIGGLSHTWAVAGIGDFGGDGRDDILLRNTSSGQLYLYEMNGNRVTPSNIGGLSPAWAVAGIGDFGGDGKDDILLRNTVSGQLFLYEMNGNRVTPSNIGGLSPAWAVAGIGDFGGDGKDDILLRNTSSGQLFLYEMDGNAVTPSNIGALSRDWTVERIADYDGDGKSDILMRHRNGALYLYEMDGNLHTSVRIGGLSTSWAVEVQ